MNLTPDSHPDYPDLHSTVIKVHMVSVYLCIFVCIYVYLCVFVVVVVNFVRRILYIVAPQVDYILSGSTNS